MKDFDLSYDEIESGIVDGSRDGGIDSAYVFVNTELLTEDSDLSARRRNIDNELVLIQSKTSEAPMRRLTRAELPDGGLYCYPWMPENLQAV